MSLHETAEYGPLNGAAVGREVSLVQEVQRTRSTQPDSLAINADRPVASNAMRRGLPPGMGRATISSRARSITAMLPANSSPAYKTASSGLRARLTAAVPKWTRDTLRPEGRWMASSHPWTRARSAY